MGSAVDPLIGSWCAPVSGWTTRNAYTFAAGGSFTNISTGDIPSSESTDPGCHLVESVTGTYTEDTASGVLTIMRQPSSETRSVCTNGSDNGTGPGLRGAGTDMFNFSVTGNMLIFGTGSSAVALTRC